MGFFPELGNKDAPNAQLMVLLEVGLWDLSDDLFFKTKQGQDFFDHF